MRVNRTYSLSYNTILSLNETVSAKHRSRFVDKAILNRLHGKEGMDIDIISTRRLYAILHARNDVPEHIKILILKEMNS